MAPPPLTPTGRVILGMIALGRQTGYDIKQFVDKSTRHFWAASYGQIYPELRRLEEQGLVDGQRRAVRRPRPNGLRADRRGQGRAQRVARARAPTAVRAARRGDAEAVLLGHRHCPSSGSTTSARCASRTSASSPSCKRSRTTADSCPTGPVPDARARDRPAPHASSSGARATERRLADARSQPMLTRLADLPLRPPPPRAVVAVVGAVVAGAFGARVAKPPEPVRRQRPGHPERPGDEPLPSGRGPRRSTRASSRS